jgi:Putative prokaryotic signal transducing protein
MQIVYRAKNIIDAEKVRDVLVREGVAAHIGDLVMADMFRVQVDNRCLEQARRILAACQNQTSPETN